MFSGKITKNNKEAHKIPNPNIFVIYPNIVD